MASADVFKPYIEKLLKEMLGVEELIVDNDGDVPIRSGTAMYYVRVLDGDPVMVRVFSPIVRNLPAEPPLEMYKRLNDINAEVSYARLMFIDGDILGAIDMVAESTNKEALELACGRMGWVSDHYDNELQGLFGGELMFTDDGSKPADAAEVDT